MNSRQRVKNRLHSCRYILLEIAASVSSLLTIACLSSAQEAPSLHLPITITVNTGRPLAEVLSRVQQELQSPIDYEEAPYESAVDLKSISILQNGSPRTLRVRPIVDFSVILNVGDSTAYLAAQSVLSAYIIAALPGTYKVVQQINRVDVMPTSVLGANGSARDVTPVMSWPVTFPLARRSIAATLQLIADSVSRGSGTKVLALNLPFGILDTVEFGANGESAGDVIENLGVKLGRTVSYQCVYDATSETHYLNLSLVAPKPVPGGPALHGLQKHPTAGPANSPFFIKQKH